ncbi:MAG: CU044_5270 family protein [Thermoleophilia bacterium]|nr:CU044_5270 family protein [Thermoleophilia bacterium]
MADVNRMIDAAYPDAADPTEAQTARARHRLRNAAVDPRPRMRVPRIRTIAVTGAAAALLGGAGLVRLVSPGDATMTANAAVARALEPAAVAAAGSGAIGPVPAGKFLYVHTRAMNMATSVGGGGDVRYLFADDRQVWLAPDGAGLLRTSSRPVRFVSGSRDAYRAALAQPRGAENVRLGACGDCPEGTPSTTAASFAAAGVGDDVLAAHADDPEGLAGLLRVGAGKYGGQPTEDEMFTMVGDGLRESLLSPAARTALFRVAAYVPGVESLGTRTDSTGRRGVAIARVDSKGLRTVLIFDPATSQVLEEQSIAVDPPPDLDIPAGTVTGRSTLLRVGIADAEGVRP